MKVSSVQNTYKHSIYSPNSGSAPFKKNIVSPAGVMIGAIVSAVAVHKVTHPVKKVCSEYVKSLAAGVSEITGKKINPLSLSCVMNKEEFIEQILKLKKNNYVYTPENIKNFGFHADFHMHTNHTDGKISVKKLLNEISVYSNKLFQRTGRKFIFSITDHDSVKAVKEALVIISENPEKFRNVRFIPGVELSFSHKVSNASNPCEISEVLAYGFNPFKIDKYCDNLQTKRNLTIDNMLSDIRKALPLTNFNKEELIKTYNLNPDCFMMNSQWAVNHYAQTKHAITIQASRHNADPEKLYTDMMKNIDVKNRNVWYLKKNNVLDKDIDETNVISNVRKKYEPHLINNQIVLTNESSFENLINLFKDDNNVVLSFAHPYFTAMKFHHPNKALNSFIYKSNGLIRISEAYHQAYPKDVSLQKVNETNDYLKHLIKIGGSDNHKETYIGVNE